MGSSIWTSRTYEGHDGKLHLSCAETAKLIRGALKKAFPGTKFSVRSDSYSGGASVRVHWMDGPTGKQVAAVTDAYEGAGFDGMIDLKYHVEHWLDTDGTVTVAHTSGTEGSRGYVPAVISDPPSATARLVSFGADYVITQRSISEERMAEAKAEIEAFVGESIDNGKAYPAAVYFDRDSGEMILAHDTHGRGEWGSTLVQNLAYGRDYTKAVSS